MRAFAMLLAVLLGCSYEYNYYGPDGGCAAPVDGGVTDMPGYTDELGEYHETEANQGIFRYDSKLQGVATLLLQQPPAAPAAGAPWPNVMETPARAGAQTLIDLATRDGQPHVVSVSLGNVGPQVSFNPMGPAYQPEVVAILDIGVGVGFTVQVEVDFIQGLQFSLECSRLQLHAVYRELPGAAPVAAPFPTIQVGASVASGTLAHGRQPQRTLGSTNVMAPAALQLWMIPLFAKSLRVAALPNNITPTVSLADPAGANAVQYPIAAFPSADLPIPNGTVLVSYQNTSLINDIERRLIFELAL